MSGFPNPIDWAIDQVSGFVTSTTTAGFELMIGGLTAWVIDAVVWTVSGIFDFFLDSTDPNVQADWFITGDGPYATTVHIGAVLLLLFLFLGITQGIVRGDVGGMIQRIALDLPVSVLGMVGLVTITQALIALTDALSTGIIETFQDDVNEFSTVVASLDGLNGGPSTAFVVFVLGLVTVLAGLILLAELVIRSALIYIVVALAPLVFAARVWPEARGATRKLLELLLALILSKLVIAIALSVGAAAAVGAGSGGEVTALPTPEVFAEDPGGSVTSAVGILLTAAAAFGVAAFMPLMVVRLLPVTEGAAVAQGVKGAPIRAAHTGLLIGNAASGLGGRLGQLGGGSDSAPDDSGNPPDGDDGSLDVSAIAGGESGASEGSAAGAEGASAGGAEGAAAGGGVGAAVAVAAAAGTKATEAAKKGVDAGVSAAEAASSGPSDSTGAEDAGDDLPASSTRDVDG